jgi:hypothetical protein
VTEDVESLPSEVMSSLMVRAAVRPTDWREDMVQGGGGWGSLSRDFECPKLNVKKNSEIQCDPRSLKLNKGVDKSVCGDPLSHLE